MNQTWLDVVTNQQLGESNVVRRGQQSEAIGESNVVRRGQQKALKTLSLVQQ